MNVKYDFFNFIVISFYRYSSAGLDIFMQEIVTRYIQYYNTFEIEKMLDLFTNDCVFENISNVSGILKCHGKKELFELAIKSRELFKARKQTVTNWVIGKNKIAVEIDYEGILAADLPGGIKAGDTLRLKGVSIYEFESGKIKRLADFS